MARKRSVFLAGLQSVLTRIAQRQRWNRLAIYAGLFAVVWLWVVSAPTLARMAPIAATNPPAITQSSDLLEEGNRRFRAGDWQAAIDLLQQAVKAYQAAQDLSRQAIALSNLGSVQFAIGQIQSAADSWQQATAIYLQVGDRAGAVRSRINQAEAWKALGQSRRAIELLTGAWAQEVAADSLEKAWLLRSLGDLLLSVGGTIDPAQKDLNPQALLEQSLAIAQAQKAGEDVSAAWFSLGNLASLELKNTVRLEINTSRPIGQKMRSALKWAAAPETTQANSTGTIATALQAYQAAIETATSPSTTVQAQLGQLNLLVSQVQTFTQLRQEFTQQQAVLATQPDEPAAQDLADLVPTVEKLEAEITKLSTYILALVPQIRTQLDQLPASRSGITARINFANTLVKLKKESSDSSPLVLIPQESPLLPPVLPEAARILATAIEQARALQDQRSESIAVGSLAGLYETTGLRYAQSNQRQTAQSQFNYAEQLTQKALFLAQANDAPDIAYQWQWQLARVYEQLGKDDQAIESYRACVNTLEPLRKNLVVVNQDLQYDFRDSVAPCYRQFVRLLLQPSGAMEVSQKQLEEARQQIESLQLAELDNFFREACLEGQKVLIDQLVDQDNPDTAVIYPIILSPQQLQVIVKIPGQPLMNLPRSIELPPTTSFDKLLTELRSQLTNVEGAEQAQAISQQVYDWLIAPFYDQLKAKQVDTLVFVQDGAFRDIPMAALYNSKSNNYLIDEFAIAVSPGLQLIAPKTAEQPPLNVLVAGLSEQIPPNPYGFTALPAVKDEVDLMQKAGLIKQPPLLEENFTNQSFKNTINAAPFNVVHLATHGRFSSRKEDTFILTHDGPLNVEQLSEILSSRSRTRAEAIDLLVLSACETAKGDSRATLGLAGIAVKAGVRSTLASLWTIADAPTPALINRFYTGLKQASNPQPAERMTKAKALRSAQLALKEQDSTPRVWAPYVLVGDWL